MSLFSENPAKRLFFRSIIANIIMRLTRRFALPISASPSNPAEDPVLVRIIK